jgi:hypothetical protein
MPVTGDIDLQRPLVEQGMTIFRSFERDGQYRLLPEGLAIATRANNRPDFLLELVRGQTPLLPPVPYGVIDFRIQPRYRIDDALITLRKQQSKAMLEEVAFVSGFLRLTALSDVVNAAPELFNPIPLVWNGLDSARFVLRLPLNPALLLKKALLAEALPLTAIAEMFFSGVSPRLPVAVRFDPALLMSKIAALGDSERQVLWQHLVQFFRRDVELLPLEIVRAKKDLDPDEFAHALADRVVHRFGTFIPAPTNDGQTYLRLPAPGEIGSGSFEWDLSESITVTRPLVLTFNPLSVARQMIRDNGEDSVIRETTVPALRIGTVHVTISANLPPERLGVLSLGVTISAPPRPPARPQAVIETVEFVAPNDSATALLHLSPAEKPNYTFKSFVVMEDGFKRHEGQELPHSGEYLSLQPADFPLTFVPIEAAPGLLELANIRGVCSLSKNGSQFQQTFDLNSDHRSAVLALLKGEVATLEIEARSKDGQRVLRLNSLPAAPLRLGLTSFPEYGPHQIDIECVFRNDIRLLAIDLVPEESSESPTEITTVHFTPAKLKREWNWFAKSPFYPGYKYRLHETPEHAPTAWSPTQSAFEPLVIDPGLSTGGAP